MIAIAISMTSCLSFRTLHSTTYIKAQDAFILGDNEHGTFRATVTNISNVPIDVWQYPMSGGRHSLVTLGPSEKAKVKVDANTSIHIENASKEEVAVELKARGDIGLSMSYREK